MITDDYLGDFISLELVNGELLLKYENGGGLTSNKMTRVGTDLNDGHTHHISISVKPTGANILLQSNNTVYYGETISSVSKTPVFDTPCYIGGFGISNNATSFHLENEISLVSTITSFYLNHTALEYGNVIDSNSIQFGSVHNESLCHPDTCSVNHQQCRDVWLSYICDCISGYSGDSCQLLSTVHFEPTSALQFSVVNISGVIQFEMTVQSDSGFILSAVNKVSNKLQMHAQNIHNTGATIISIFTSRMIALKKSYCSWRDSI